MTFAAHPVPTNYRQPLVGSLEPRFRRALAIATGIGLAFLVVVWLAPEPAPAPTTVEELPERFARLILDEPAKPAPPVAATPRPKAEIEAPTTRAEPKAESPKAMTPPEPRAERRAPRSTEAPKVAQDRGTAGRAKAKAEVTEQLASVTSGVDEALESLASVLPATQDGAGSGREPASRRRGGRVRSGRGSAATGPVATRSTERGGAVAGEALAARSVDLGSYGDFDLSGVTGSASAASGGGGVDRQGDRSASDLMNVVRRYAPGIRFCYDSALESDRSLRGKMVFRITVAADGSVADVDVVEDSLGDGGVRSCALTQIRAWRFGTAASASVFDAPFVFRPQG